MFKNLFNFGNSSSNTTTTAVLPQQQQQQTENNNIDNFSTTSTGYENSEGSDVIQPTPILVENYKPNSNSNSNSGNSDSDNSSSYSSGDSSSEWNETSSTTTTTTTTTTENGAISHNSVGDARVELFFKLVRGLKVDELNRMLEASWKEDPLNTLKIMFNTRDCRGGKGERDLFLHMMNFVAKKSPQNFILNMNQIPEFGRWLDLIVLSENKNMEATIIFKIAEQLLTDHKNMMSGKCVSLCAKWFPTEGSKWDKKLHVCRKVSKMMRIDMKELRSKYIVPLRTYLKIVEKYMCSKKWDEIDYNKVPSNAMNKLKKAFAKNDSARFNEWKLALSNGKPDVKVNAKVLYPHDLVRQYINTNKSAQQPDIVIEEQWKVLVEEIKKLGQFDKSLVVSDVSGSMCGTPMEVSIALGLIISECTVEPFKNKVITFHETPTFHNVVGVNLLSRVNNLAKAPWGGNTNFIAVFHLLLSKALEHSVPPEKMPNRLYVLSDMQFDQASSNNYATNYSTIENLYKINGYNVPEIIFWNLRANTNDFPIADANKPGVALISGFSPSILKSVLNCGKLTPKNILNETINNERYNCIKYIQ